MTVSPDIILITTLAEYQTRFWIPVAQRLRDAGREVRLLAFDDRSAEMAAAQGISVVNMYRAGLEGGAPIDASGQLTSGEQFTGPAQLAAILAGAKRDLFVRCLTEKLLIYALGRGLEYSDRAATGQIATAVQPERYKFSTLILNVVKSAPFEQRRAPAQ